MKKGCVLIKKFFNMKYIYIIGGMIIFIGLCLLPLRWIDVTDFDKYKFTEEYYKFIVSSVQLMFFGAVFGVVLNNIIERNHKKREDEKIEKLLAKQKEHKDIIINCFKNNTKDRLVDALSNFKAISCCLEDIDIAEKVQLAKLNYLDIESEIDYIIKHINSKDICEMPNAKNLLMEFLNNYFDNRLKI
jgi:hypothetical protein